MSFGITGVGTAVPREWITQDDAARLAVELAGDEYGHGQAVHVLYRRAGVKQRYSAVITSSTNGRPATQGFFPIATSANDCGPTTGDRMRCYETVALELAVRAASDALHEAEIRPQAISDLVTVTCTGFSAPGVDIALVERLGLDRGVSRSNIGFMGCHGALNGLRVASALGHSPQRRSVLLCCVELCSIHHQYAANSQQIVANALFSDGAAAVVGTADSSVRTSWRLVDQASLLLADSQELMSWRIGDNGFQMHLSPQVPQRIRETLRPWFCRWLAGHGLAVEDVKSWAIHPGGPRILAACQESLSLSDDDLAASHEVLANYGNMSSPTVLFILNELRDRQSEPPCVVLAFGPGLTMEAALLC